MIPCGATTISILTLTITKKCDILYNMTTLSTTIKMRLKYSKNAECGFLQNVTHFAKKNNTQHNNKNLTLIMEIKM
jgi:hypothetical protein